MEQKKLFLIDGSGYIYRAFYGIRNMSRRDGFPTNALFGFIKMLQKVVLEQKPDYLALVFDEKGPTFRNDLDVNYKANRKPMPDELRVQVPLIRQAVSAFNIPIFSLAGYEADDILGTLSDAGERAGMSVVVVSGDKDMMQLVTPNVSLLDTGKDQWFQAAEVQEKWGVPPEKVTQVMALTGDTSDNIPGVPKIGMKTAAQLINEFGDLENLLAQAHTIKQTMRRNNLIEFADQARLSMRLVTIDRQAPVDCDLARLKRAEPDAAALKALYTEMEFTSLLRQLEQAEASNSSSNGVVTVSPASDDETARQQEALAVRSLDYRILVTEGAFRGFLAELQSKKRFSLDTETTGTDPVRAELVGLSFSWKTGQATYLPVAHSEEAAPNGQLNRDRVLAALKPILEDPDRSKTGQNIKYEYVILLKYGIRLAGMDRDPMLFSHLIYGNIRRHNLDAIAFDELGRTTITFKEVAGVGKKQVCFNDVSLEKAGPYACEDAEVTWQAAERMESTLAAMASVWQLYQQVERPLIAVLGDMEQAGVLIDRPLLKQMSEGFTKRREVLVEQIHGLAGESFNVNSTQQLGQILFEKMGLKGGRKTKTGFSTDVTVLTKLADKGHELPIKLLEYRSLTKLQSTYTDALQELINPETGRVHTSYNQGVALTGRLSSSEPNLQNIPIRTEEGRAIRQAFIAPEGWLLLAADYSQIELRLLAHLGQVPRLMEAFAQDQDIHSATAAELFGASLFGVDPVQRRMAKTINFGLVYGMSEYGLAKRLGISNMDARDYMSLYFKRYDGVRSYMESNVQFAQTHGYVESIGGRRCFIRDIENSNRNLRELAERTAINAPLQGSAADLIKMAMIRLHRTLQENNSRSRIILQVHDELVLEVPKEELERVKLWVREAMEGAMELSVPLKVDMGVGVNWDEAH
ncbi:MAG: DNA polymerase I [Magnetococcales bacterium]|nr:DNA polymerase I [Magnetococcales bacterium]